MSTHNDRSTGDGGDGVLAAEFALGLLDAAEHQRTGARLAAEPALRAELGFWRSRLAGLDSQFAEQPAPNVLPRVEQRLFGADAARAAGGWWNNLAFWRSLTAAAAAVAVVAVGFNLTQPRVDPQEFATQLVAALQSHEGSGVEFVALYDQASGKVRLTALSGAAVPEKDFELWYIKGEEPAVSMGVIPVDARTEIELPQVAREKFGEGIVLAVTLEQKGGSPTGVAQGPIVALGSATPI